MEMNWKWLGGALGVGILIGYLLPHPAAPSDTKVVAGATASAAAKGGKQIVRIPVPGATVYIEVIQECPDLSVSSTVTVYVDSKCVQPRVQVGVSLTGYTILGADLSIRLGPVWMGPTFAWQDGPLWGGRIAYSF